MSPSQGTPSTAACFVAVAVMDALVHVLGLRRTLRLARRVPARAAAERPAAMAAETARRVAAAAAFYPRRALCLEQSLALYLLLRRRGVAAELRLGAQPLPFYAHAWIEVDGEPIAEQQDMPATLTMFPTLGV